MRFRSILSLATFFLTCFTIAVFNQNSPAKEAAYSAKRGPENQSVAGKITSVGDAGFTLGVAKKDQQEQTVEFLLDDKTRVEGKLTIGAEAMVEYRSDSGKNIAVHVVVKANSGSQLY